MIWQWISEVDKYGNPADLLSGMEVRLTDVWKDVIIEALEQWLQDTNEKGNLYNDTSPLNKGVVTAERPRLCRPCLTSTSPRNGCSGITTYPIASN